MRLLTDSVEDEGFVTSTQIHRKPKTATMPRRQSNNNNSNSNTNQQQKMNLTDFSSDESSMSSSPSPADYVFDIMYHDQQASLSMLDMKNSFYEPFFGTLSNSNANNDNNNNSNNNNNNNNNNNSNNSTNSSDNNVGGMATSLSFQNLATATTNDVLQQLFPYDDASATTNNNNKPTVVDLLDTNFPMKQQHKKSKKTNTNTRKYNKKQKKTFTMNNTHFHPSSSSSSSMNMMLDGGNMTVPGSSNIWIDPSIYPLWPNYICLYLEYSLPYDPSVSCLEIIIEIHNLLIFFMIDYYTPYTC